MPAWNCECIRRNRFGRSYILEADAIARRIEAVEKKLSEGQIEALAKGRDRFEGR